MLNTEVTQIKENMNNLTQVVNNLATIVNRVVANMDVKTERHTSVAASQRNTRNTPSNTQTSGATAPSITYAQALAKSMIPSGAIKNIELRPSEGNFDTLLQTIQSDKICADKNIVSVKQRGKCNLVLKCSDAKSTDEVEATLKQKYGESIVIKGIIGTRPQIKITRILCEIMEQNIWLKDAIINVDRSYIIAHAPTHRPSGPFPSIRFG